MTTKKQAARANTAEVMYRLQRDLDTLIEAHGPDVDVEERFTDAEGYTDSDRLALTDAIQSLSAAAQAAEEAAMALNRQPD